MGHRTTSDLPIEADIVIVGSGITGASAARFLAEDARAKDLSMVMLDAREACWCATGRVCQAIRTLPLPHYSALTMLLLHFIERRPLSASSLLLDSRRRGFRSQKLQHRQVLHREPQRPVRVALVNRLQDLLDRAISESGRW